MLATHFEQLEDDRSLLAHVGGLGLDFGATIFSTFITVFTTLCEYKYTVGVYDNCWEQQRPLTSLPWGEGVEWVGVWEWVWILGFQPGLTWQLAAEPSSHCQPPPLLPLLAPPAEPVMTKNAHLTHRVQRMHYHNGMGWNISSVKLITNSNFFLGVVIKDSLI